MKRATFIAKYVAEIEAGNAAIFAGAGLSVPAGFVNWRELLREIADGLDLDIDREHDLIGVAQYHVNRHGQQRGHLNQAIIHALSTDGPPTPTHRLLAQLPIEVWWTTNYDKLIERSLELEGKTADVKFSVTQLAHTKPRRDAVVYKMHGDVDSPADAILTRDDYEKYSTERGAFLNALSGDLVSKTFLFLGFSFTDPNLASVLANIRTKFADNQRPHYAVFRKENRRDFKSQAEFNYAVTKQSLYIEDLHRFNINSVLVDEYSEIYEIVAEIHSKISRRYVFVSTSAVDFSPWGEPAVTEFMRKLGQIIIQRGFRLVSGVGLGTGNALLTGAIQEIAEKGWKLDDELLIRPFPQFIVDREEREGAWRLYREDMLARCGIALFLFGNKESDTGVVPATGMIEEFEIASRLGISVVPVGATGSVARQLVSNDLKIGANGGDFVKLNTSTEDLMTLLGPIVDLIEKIRNTL